VAFDRRRLSAAPSKRRVIFFRSHGACLPFAVYSRRAALAGGACRPRVAASYFLIFGCCGLSGRHAVAPRRRPRPTAGSSPPAPCSARPSASLTDRARTRPSFKTTPRFFSVLKTEVEVFLLSDLDATWPARHSTTIPPRADSCRALWRMVFVFRRSPWGLRARSAVSYVYVRCFRTSRAVIFFSVPRTRKMVARRRRFRSFTQYDGRGQLSSDGQSGIRHAVSRRLSCPSFRIRSSIGVGERDHTSIEASTVRVRGVRLAGI